MCQQINEVKQQISGLSEHCRNVYNMLEELDDIRRRIRDEIYSLSNRTDRIHSAVDGLNNRIEESKAVIERPLSDRIKVMLEGEYSLRTIEAISDATGASEQEIYDVLERAGIDFVTRVRTRDGAKLIGLAERN